MSDPLQRNATQMPLTEKVNCYVLKKCEVEVNLVV